MMKRIGQWFEERLNPLKQLKQWLDTIEMTNPQQARLVYRLIPGQCPFERTLKWGDRVLLRIPPLCKLNPVYDQLVALRFRAACYLVEHCNFDLAALQ